MSAEQGGATEASSLAYILALEGADIGLVRASIWQEGSKDGAQVKTAVLFGLQCDPAVPLALAGLPLVSRARG